GAATQPMDAQRERRHPGIAHAFMEVSRLQRNCHVYLPTTAARAAAETSDHRGLLLARLLSCARRTDLRLAPGARAPGRGPEQVQDLRADIARILEPPQPRQHFVAAGIAGPGEHAAEFG